MRKKEHLDYRPFEIGEGYSRPEIADLGNVQPLSSPREWTGIVEFNNCILLFSTLVKDDLPPEHAYTDLIVDDEFLWESQNRNTQNSAVVLRIIGNDVPILLFCRLTGKTKGKTTPFTYAGTLTALDYEGEKPVEFRFSLDEFMLEPPEALRQLYEWRPDSKPQLRAIKSPTREPRLRSGQGRQADPKKRAAVELRAMEVAREYYSGQGFCVTDTSAKRPYDLECRSEGSIVRVEVKGLTGGLGAVDVTSGEVSAARIEAVQTDLFIVYGIEIKKNAENCFVGINGTVHRESPWKVRESQLEPTRFRYTPTDIMKK